MCAQQRHIICKSKVLISPRWALFRGSFRWNKYDETSLRIPELKSSYITEVGPTINPNPAEPGYALPLQTV